MKAFFLEPLANNKMEHGTSKSGNRSLERKVKFTFHSDVESIENWGF
jgi:hypothetical protein